VLGDDHGGVAAHLGEPVAELLGIAHRRRQRHHLDGLGQQDDDLLPHPAPEAVGEVVNLVHDDVAEALESPRPGIQHVAEYLGRHDDNGGLTTDGGVPGEQPDVVGSVAGDEVVVLLVGQRLDRGGVERLAAGREGGMDGELTDDRLTGPGGSGDEHSLPPLDGEAGLDLEVIEREALLGGEVTQQRPGHGAKPTSGR